MDLIAYFININKLILRNVSIYKSEFLFYLKMIELLIKQHLEFDT
jgi:hypothetical protein